MIKIDILSKNIDELEFLMLELGEKPFRAKQIFSWLHEKHVKSFKEMTNIPKTLTAKFEEAAQIAKSDIVKKYQSQIDETTKYLIELEGDHVIECVYMKYKHGNTVCISSQAGCRMGCSFCASTKSGLARNLTSSEMLAQVYEIAKDKNERISNVVVMGGGEPLDNYDNLLKFLMLINDTSGMNISHRSITVSTCGLVDAIKELAKEKLQITLALSLHAPNDEIRRTLMPISKRYKIEETISACKKYAEETGRRVSYEYAMIYGINDSEEHAKELGDRLRHSLAHVNLIPINEIQENDYKKSRIERIKFFEASLSEKGVSVTLRRELGKDISAACGQLRNSLTKKD